MAKKSQSRMENILENKLDGTPIEGSSQSRIEVLLNRLIATMSPGSQTGGGIVDVSGIRDDLNSLAADLSTLEKTVGENKTNIDIIDDKYSQGLSTISQTMNDNTSQFNGQLSALKYTVDTNKNNTDAVIDSIENNIDALEEEIHEPEILNAPIEIEGAFPQVITSVFNEAEISEMYVWTYFVPEAGREKVYPKQAGMEHLKDLMDKLVMKHEKLKDMDSKIQDLESKYNTLYQACVAEGIIK